MSKLPPADEYLRVPVCCAECEEFWLAQILEIDEKHTSRAPAGKASLLMARGPRGSVTQSKTGNIVKKPPRNLFSGLGCINPTGCGDAQFSVIVSGRNSHHPRLSSGKLSWKATLVNSGRCHQLPQKKMTVTAMRSKHVVPAYGPSSYVEQIGYQSNLGPLSKRLDLEGNLSRTSVRHTASSAPNYDVVSAPRRHSHSYHRGRRSAVFPEPPEAPPNSLWTGNDHLSTVSDAANQYVTDSRQNARLDAKLGGHEFKPIRTRIDGGRSEESMSPMFAPRYCNDGMGSRGLRHTFYANPAQLKPLPSPATRLLDTDNFRAQYRRFRSQPTTPWMRSPTYSSLGMEGSQSQAPRVSAIRDKHTSRETSSLSYAEEFSRYNYLPTTPHTLGSKGIWNSNDLEDRHSDRSDRKTIHTLREFNDIPAVDGAVSQGKQSGYEDGASSRNQSPQFPSYVPGRSCSYEVSSERILSRTSTNDSGYTLLSIPRSDCSASSDSEGTNGKSPISSARSRIAKAQCATLDSRSLHAREAKNLGIQTDMGLQRPSSTLNTPNNVENLSRKYTASNSLLEPIVLFTGHGCRSETDDNSENDSDVEITNPDYFKHIISKPQSILKTY